LEFTCDNYIRLRVRYREILLKEGQEMNIREILSWQRSTCKPNSPARPHLPSQALEIFSDGFVQIRLSKHDRKQTLNMTRLCQCDELLMFSHVHCKVSPCLDVVGSSLQSLPFPPTCADIISQRQQRQKLGETIKEGPSLNGTLPPHFPLYPASLPAALATATQWPQDFL
jgi:hypothetical protein